MKMMSKNKNFDELKKAWISPGSPIYLSKNWKEISNYCAQNNIDLSKNNILKFLELRQSSLLRYDDRSKRKISETGKAFVLRGKFFSQLHGDHLMLSKKFSYGTALRYIMIIVCQLSRYILVEPLSSIKYEKVEIAFKAIMERIKKIDPYYTGGHFFSDGGSEWISASFVNLLKTYGLKSNVVGQRAFRKSKGSGVAESSIRRFRMNLETVYLEHKDGVSFRDKLKYAEKACNEKRTAALGMSPQDALSMRPQDVVSISNSIRMKRRKYLKRELIDQKQIKLGTIVRIRLYVDKEFSSKESYDRFSPYFLVIGIDKTREIFTYRVCDIFTFATLGSSYSRAELKICNISLFGACDKEEKRIKKVVKYKNEIVYYETFYRDYVFCAKKSIVA